MSELSKQQFLEFTEAVYLAKLQGHPISEEFGGWCFGIRDANPKEWGPGRYRLEAIGPFGTVIVEDAVLAEDVQQFAARMFAEIVTAESRTAGRPMKYEYLPEGIKGNLALGHVLAEHTATSDGVVDKHITTVQLSVAHDEKGRSIHYCNDVCGDLCEPETVEVVPIELPQNAPAYTTGPAPATAPPATWGTGGQVGFMEKSVGEMMVELEVLRLAQRRLETVRAFAYDKYRESLHDGLEETADIYAGVLFLMVTEMLPSADEELYGRFATFLASSVIEEDAETLPDFEADCG